MVEGSYIIVLYIYFSRMFSEYNIIYMYMNTTLRRFNIDFVPYISTLLVGWGGGTNLRFNSMAFIVLVQFDAVWKWFTVKRRGYDAFYAIYLQHETWLKHKAFVTLVDSIRWRCSDCLPSTAPPNHELYITSYVSTYSATRFRILHFNGTFSNYVLIKVLMSLCFIL